MGKLLFVSCTAVKSIKKQHLVEVRSMGNPPPAVKLTLESICLLLGEQATDWRTIRGVIIKDNFISTIVNFSTEDISYVARFPLKYSSLKILLDNKIQSMPLKKNKKYSKKKTYW